MGAVIRRMWLAVLPLAAVACAAQAEKQWYKPNQEYTTADLRRDEAACTRNRVLDEACLRERGWVPLTSDRPPAQPTGPVPGRGGSGRY
jgi:hypothetical protein